MSKKSCCEEMEQPFGYILAPFKLYAMRRYFVRGQLHDELKMSRNDVDCTDEERGGLRNCDDLLLCRGTLPRKSPPFVPLTTSSSNRDGHS